MGKFLDTEVGQLEFMVALQKPKNSFDDYQKSKCLASLPKLQIESFLSPYMPHVKALSVALENSSKINLKLQDELDVCKNNAQNETTRLKSELQTALKMLDRRSVKFVLSLIHKLNNLF